MTKNKLLLPCLIIASLVASCGNNEETEDIEKNFNENSNYGSLKGEQKKLVGMWSQSTSTKCGDFIFFANGECISGDNHGTWTYSESAKQLITDINGWSFNISVIEDDLWSGTSINSGTPVMFKRSYASIPYSKAVCFLNNTAYYNKAEDDTLYFGWRLSLGTGYYGSYYIKLNHNSYTHTTNEFLIPLEFSYGINMDSACNRGLTLFHPFSPKDFLIRLSSRKGYYKPMK